MSLAALAILWACWSLFNLVFFFCFLTTLDGRLLLSFLLAEASSEYFRSNNVELLFLEHVLLFCRELVLTLYPTHLFRLHPFSMLGLAAQAF